MPGGDVPDPVEAYPLDVLTTVACAMMAMGLASCAPEGGPVFAVLAVLCAAAGVMLLCEEKKEDRRG